MALAASMRSNSAAQPRAIKSFLGLTLLAFLAACWQSDWTFSSYCGRHFGASNRQGRALRHTAMRYAPASVSEAWQNHFDAFGEQDLDKIMLDYDETSTVTLYNNADGSKVVYKGTDHIRHMFTELFDGLSDLSTLEAPVSDVYEMSGGGGQVFLVWKCPGCGFDTATDTFIFGPDKKIKFQNIVVTEYDVE
eukprot:TRINITY_DN109474_c0_g1_i1.p1 TRINITY_DN109474_c0_g1~~TRINITY_DN109474_c0_g1_i1.p1  ORF type:complete len:192 (+),score=37.85 TRINITY_DN109474_c0_g1_i1:88-663(+)